MAMRDKGDETKLKILRAAQTLFYTNGFNNTTIDEIATAADTSHALVHYHFRTKNNLMYMIGLNVTKDQLKSIDCQFTSENVLVRCLIATFLFWKHALSNQKFMEFSAAINDVTLYKDPMAYYDFFLSPYEGNSKIISIDDRKRKMLGAVARGIDLSIIELARTDDMVFDSIEIAEFNINAFQKILDCEDFLKDLTRAKELATSSTESINEGVFCF